MLPRRHRRAPRPACPLQAIFDAAWDLQGFVGFSKPLGAIVVAFRGTDSHSIYNWVQVGRKTGGKQASQAMPGQQCQAARALGRTRVGPSTPAATPACWQQGWDATRPGGWLCAPGHTRGRGIPRPRAASLQKMAPTLHPPPLPHTHTHTHTALRLQNMRTWRTDLALNYPGAPAHALVHGGFLYSYNASSLAPNITLAVARLRQQHPDAPIYVSGHRWAPRAAAHGRRAAARGQGCGAGMWAPLACKFTVCGVWGLC